MQQLQNFDQIPIKLESYNDILNFQAKVPSTNSPNILVKNENQNNSTYQQQRAEFQNILQILIRQLIILSERVQMLEQRQQKIFNPVILQYPQLSQANFNNSSQLQQSLSQTSQPEQTQLSNKMIETTSSSQSNKASIKLKRKSNVLKQKEYDQNKKIKCKNVPLFIGTRLKNCLKFDCPIKQRVKQLLEEKNYAYDEFLKWLEDPLMKLKEIWHFQITWTIYSQEPEKEKYFKYVLRCASYLFLQSYAINSIIWSGQSYHTLTLSNANIKKPAVLKKISKFIQGINNPDNLKGMFNEKEDLDAPLSGEKQ